MHRVSHTCETLKFGVLQNGLRELTIFDPALPRLSCEATAPLTQTALETGAKLAVQLCRKKPPIGAGHVVGGATTPFDYRLRLRNAFRLVNVFAIPPSNLRWRQFRLEIGEVQS